MVHGAFASHASTALVFNSARTGVNGTHGFWRFIPRLVAVYGATIGGCAVADHERDLAGTSETRT
jgi:hypothetical protein